MSLTFDSGSSDPACTDAGGTVTCDFGGIVNGATPLRTFFATATSVGLETVTTVAELVGEFDPDLGNNTVDAPLTIDNFPPFFDVIPTETVNEDVGVQQVTITGVLPGPAGTELATRLNSSLPICVAPKRS